MSYYNDDIPGVKKMLNHMAQADYVTELNTAIYEPDPVVEGCWLVTFRDGSRLLCYVGDHSLAPDFEDING